MNISRQQLTLEGKVETQVLYKDSAGTEITEDELSEKVSMALSELSAWELRDIINFHVPFWELEEYAKDEEGNWYE